ncbi:MAG: hypothetical protein Q8Q14_14375, partial [Gemmatimonadales bacterium]|nr:hypothetical protein [Gemmatimonadales bacterium]
MATHRQAVLRVEYAARPRRAGGTALSCGAGCTVTLPFATITGAMVGRPVRASSANRRSGRRRRRVVHVEDRRVGRQVGQR